MGEISTAFCALSTEEFAASCVKCNPYVWDYLCNGLGYHRAVLNGPSMTYAVEDDCGVCSHWSERTLVLVMRITDFQISALVILTPVPTEKEAKQVQDNFSVCIPVQYRE